MSACARSDQRPPRSRASSSRTSSQTCSESISTPSRSKMTASITASRTRPGHERAEARLRRLASPNVAYEERVRPGSHLVADRALQPTQRSHEQRRAARAGFGRDAVPHRDRWNPAGEVLGEPVLPGCEQRNRTAAGFPEKLVHRGLARHANPTSGGSSESETSEPTVSPSFCPPASTVTTHTPDG